MTVTFGRHALAAESLPPTIIEEMEEMFLGLGFSETVAQKLVNDHVIDSPLTQASISDDNITAICVLIRKPGGLVSSKKLDRGTRFPSW